MLFAALVLSGQDVPRSDALPDAPPVAPVQRKVAPTLTISKILLVGDSTVAPVGGWGGAFCAHHVAPQVACLNVARGGRSTRSYREEGSWNEALAEASVPGYAGVFVLIQFGHNDGNPRMGARTDLDPEFGDNLRRFVRELRARGATPILVTPMVRRLFSVRGFYNSLEPWAERTRTVARELSVPLVDLNARSADLVRSLGAEGASALGHPAETNAPAADSSAARYRFHPRKDPTHLGDEGARKTAAIVAEELARVVPALAPVIAP
nr:rhamnogalacturonan acetylesterase [Sphingomonas sp. ACRSK]